MATNKATRDTMVIVAVIVAACVTIFANLLADKKFGRIDLTKEGRYSLSQPFRNILGQLEDTLEITYYVSEKSPPPGFESYKRNMLDKLHEIETASNGKVKVTPVDPTDDKELRERLKKDGFENEIMVTKKDQQVAAVIFSGLEMTYQAKPKVSVPQVYEAEFLEYAIGSKILELTQKKKPTIAIMTPPEQGPRNPMMGGPEGSGYEWLKEGAWDQEKRFEIKNVDLTESSPIPADSALLIVARPKNLNERQKYEIEKYLAGGGKMLLLASEFKISYEFGWRVEKTPTGLEDYLKESGLTMGQDFVADNNCLRVPMINKILRRVEFKRKPFFIKILPENIDQENVLTRLMPNLVMLSPSELILDKEKLSKNNLTSEVLAKTSNQTWTIPFSEAVDFEHESSTDEEKQVYTGQRNVIVVLKGQFPFGFEGKPAPPWGAAGAPPTPENKDKKEEPLQKKAGMLAVISSPEAFHSDYMFHSELSSVMQGNFAIIKNIAEDVSLGDDLIALRMKRYESRYIKSLSGDENDWKRFLLKVGLIGGPAISLFIIAALWFIFRRTKQVRYERKYAATIGPSSFSP